MLSTVFKEFEEDNVYSPFLEKDFDPQAHASYLVQGVVIADHLSKLSVGINRLEKEIENQVGSHYEDLLSQATGVETLEDVLNSMHSRIQTLQAGVERLRSRIVEPYNRIEQQTTLLCRLQATCEILRRIIRCLSLSQRLQEQLRNGPKDITKAATSLSELDDIGRNVDLTGIEILEKDQRLIRQARSDIEKQAASMMDKGMEMQNQTQVGTALQVFYNLGILVPCVEKTLDGLVKKLNESVSAALNVNSLAQSTAGDSTRRVGGPGKAVMPTIGQSAQFKANLWSGLEKLMEDIYTICLKTSHLHKVLAKKKDPSTHICFLDEIYKQSKSDLFTTVWKNITRILTQEFANAVKGSNFIRQALEVDYPKLVRLYADLWKKLEVISNDIMNAQTHVDLSNDEEEDDLEEKFEPEKALRDSLIPLEKAYISRSLSRLFDAVNLMFSTPGTVPAKEEIDTLIKTITSELNVSAVDRTLSETIARNVVKTVHLFCQKCEQLLVTDGEASQVIGTPSEGQQLNCNIVNQLYYVRNQVERTASATLAHLPQPVTQHLLTSVPAIDSLTSTSVAPLFSSLQDCIEAIILTMHNEDFSSSTITSSNENQCSLYMKELQSFILRATADYISPFMQSPIIKKKINALACFSLEQFVRHASLVRPIGEQGKMRLAADFAQMEMAIDPLTNRPSDLGRPFRIVRAFRPLLFQTAEHICDSSSIGDVIPFSLVLHFLFAKAPPEMRSPHQTAGWSVSRYSAWLDDHPLERERLSLVQGALEAYVGGVRSKHLTQFHPLYPVMVKLLEKGMTHCAKSK